MVHCTVTKKQELSDGWGSSAPTEPPSGPWQLSYVVKSTLWPLSVFGAAWIRPIDGLVYPAVKSGHSCVHPRILCIAAAVAPGNQAVHPAPAHQRPPESPCKNKTTPSISYGATKWRSFQFQIMLPVSVVVPVGKTFLQVADNPVAWMSQITCLLYCPRDKAWGHMELCYI